MKLVKGVFAALLSFTGCGTDQQSNLREDDLLAETEENTEDEEETFVLESRVYDISETEDYKAYGRYLDHGVIVFKFGMTWCGPCKSMDSQVLPPLAKASESRYMIIKVDLDKVTGEAKEAVRSISVSTYPTTKIYVDGKEVFSRTGFLSQSVLEKELENILKDRPAHQEDSTEEDSAISDESTDSSETNA